MNNNYKALFLLWIILVAMCSPGHKGVKKIDNHISPGTYIEDLYDENYRVRYQAAEALARLKHYEAVDIFIDILECSKKNDCCDGWNDYYAIKALGEIGDPRAIPYLIDAVLSEDWQTSRLASRSLMKFEGLDITPRILAGLNSKNKRVRQNVLSALAERKVVPAIEPVVHMLAEKHTRDDPWSNIVSQISEVLKEIDPVLSYMTIVQALRGKYSGHVDFKINAAQVLGELNLKKAVRPLMRLLKEKNPEIRAKAAASLGRLKAAEAFDLLLDNLSGNQPEVTANAVLALGQIGNPAAKDRIFALLKHRDQKVKRNAAEALILLKDPRVVLGLQDEDIRHLIIYKLQRAEVPGIFDYLKDMADAAGINTERGIDIDALHRVARTLSLLPRIDHPGAKDLLLKALNSKYSLIRDKAVSALASMNDTSGIDHLLNSLLVPDSQYIAGEIWRIEKPVTIPSLIAGTQSPDRRRRVYSAIALGYIQDQRVIRSLIRLLAAEDDLVRKCAGKSLLKLSKEETGPRKTGLTFYRDVQKNIKNIREPGIIDRLIADLKKTDRRLVNNAIEILRMVKPPRAASSLSDALQNPNASTYRIFDALLEIGDLAAAPALLKLIHSSDKELAKDAALTLAYLGGLDDIEPLKKMLSPEVYQNTSILYAMSKIKNPRSAEYLAALIKTGKIPRNDKLIEEIVDVDYERIADILVDHVKNGNNDYRNALISILCKRKDKERAARLFPYLEHESSIAELIEVCQPPHPFIARKLSAWLGKRPHLKELWFILNKLQPVFFAKHPHILSLIKRCTRHSYPEIREEALRLLGKIPGKGVFREIVKGTADKEWRVRLAAVEVLGQKKTPAAHEHLVSMIGDVNFHVRNRAEEILLSSNNPSVTKFLKEARRQEADPLLRRRAKILSKKIKTGKKSRTFVLDKIKDKKVPAKTGVQDLLILQDGGIKKLRYDKDTRSYDMECESLLINPRHIVKYDDSYFVTTINTLYRFGRRLHLEAGLKIGEIAAIAAAPNCLLVSTNKSVLTFDQELELAGKVVIGKNSHDIIAHEHIAYILDNVIIPQYILKLDIRDPEKVKLIGKKEIIGVNPHLTAHSLDVTNNEWLIFQTECSMSDNDVNLFVFSPDEMKGKRMFPVHHHPFFTEWDIEHLLECITPFSPSYAVITNAGQYYSATFNTKMNKLDLENIFDLHVKFTQERTYYFENKRILSKVEMRDNLLYIILENHLLVVDVAKKPEIIVKQSFNKTLYDFTFY